jgi:PAS domain S-box-containing protein
MSDALNTDGLDFGALLNAAPDAMAVVGEDGRMLLVNEQMLNLFGFSRTELVGQPVEMLMAEEFQGHHPELRGDYMADAQPRGMSGGRTLMARRKDGSDISVAISLSVITLDGHRLVVTAVRDLTFQAAEAAQLRRRNLEAQLMLRAAEAAAEADTVECVLVGVIDAVCEVTGWPIGHAYTRCPLKRDQLISGQHWYLAEGEAYAKFRDLSADRGFSCGEGMPGRVLESGNLLWIEDIRDGDNFPRAPAAQAAGIRSAFAIPVTVGDEVEGVLEFFSSQFMPEDEDFAQIMRNVSAQVGRVMERSRAQQELEQREQLIESLMGNVPGAIYRITDHGEEGGHKIDLMSDAIEEISGLPAAHFSGQSGSRLSDIIHPEDRALVNEKILAAISNDSAFNIEYRITHSDGCERWFSCQGNVSRDPDSGTPIVDGAIFDITPLREVQQEVERQGATFRNVFDTMADGYMVSNQDGLVTLINPRGLEILGYETLESLQHASAGDIYWDESDRDHIVAYLAENPVFKNLEVACRRGDGNRITSEFSGRIVPTDEGHLCEVTFQDVTQRKAAELALLDAREAAEQANFAKSSFMANMSHELRTPLNAILGYSEMLMEEVVDLGQDDLLPDLKKINSAGTHLLALINDVLDLSKVEAGKAEIFAEDIDVNELLDDVTSTVGPLVAKNGNRLVLERADDLGSVRQDLTKLKQSLLNLLSNAAKFTHDGEVTLRAFRELHPARDRLVLQVADSGIGIPADKLDELFDEFTQVDPSTTRQYGGTGLGLAISRRFCRLLGGDITVRSELGVGSEFTIKLPVCLAGAETDETVDAKAQASASQGELPLSAMPTTAAGRTILVIDDDPEACEIIERFLVRDGFDVVKAHSGEEGLRLAHDVHPSAITLDVMMPDMDGWAVLRSIKADPHLSDIPVVMVTMVDDKTRGYSLGATDYLTKPVDRDALLCSLDRYKCDRPPCPVMVVEDDVDTRSMLARTLKKDGWTVFEAGNGQEALDQMRREQPELILLDLMMPVMDGFQFLHELRRHEAWQNIPVIVITAKDLNEDDRRILQGKVARILEKGAYGRDQLIQNVRRLVAASGAAD